LETDLHKVLRELFKANEIVGPEKLVFKHNPMISFVTKKTKSPSKG